MPKFYNTVSQLILFITGFLVMIILLESKGLVIWAERLAVSDLQQKAVMLTTRLETHLSPLGISKLRVQLIEKLNALGWNDAERVPSGFLDDINIKRYSDQNFAELPLFDYVVNLESKEGKERRAETKFLIDPLKLPSLISSPMPAPHMHTKTETQSPKPNVHDQSSIVLDVFKPLPQAKIARRRTVALVGDSMMAVGLSAQLLRETTSFKSLQMVRAFRSGTGLSRPEVFNWMTEYPKMIGAHKPDVVIFSIGANDAQGFVVDKKVVPFGSAQWDDVYAKRVHDFLSVLAHNDAIVLMLALPPMKSKKFNEKIQKVNQISQSVIEKINQQNGKIIWWDTIDYFQDKAGEFKEFMTDPKTKKILRIRGADGIHLSDEGAAQITPILIKWLNPEA